MKEKLQELLDRENLRPGQLAERLDVNPASISHILKGRNKPGIEFLQKILRAFPKLNPDWLLLDSAQYERDGATAPAATGPFVQNPGAAVGRSGPGPTGLQHGVPGSQNGGASSSAAHGTGPHAAAGNPSLFGQPFSGGSTPTASGSPFAAGASGTPAAGMPDGGSAHDKAVKRVIVLYTDNTFESYTPTTR